jgi:hypothetical protein
MGDPAPTTNFVDLSVPPTETQRKATSNSPYQFGQYPLVDWLEMQPQRLVMLGIKPDWYNVVVGVTYQFSGPLKIWLLDSKRKTTILGTFDSLVIEIRNTSLTPNIRDEAITIAIQLT